MKRFLFLVLAMNCLIGSNVLGVIERISLDRPWTAQEIENYKSKHKKYTIHSETYREGTVPETRVVRSIEPHAPWSAAADAKARAGWSDQAKELEDKMQVRRKIESKEFGQKSDAAKKIQQAWKSKIAKVKKLNAVDLYGRTPLHHAKTEGQTRVLLAAKADPNAVDGFDSTPLHYAKTEGQTRALLDAGADPNVVDLDGRTPLYYAETEGQTRALLDAGADPNVVDLNGRTLLYYAKTEGQTRALLDAGADPNAVDVYGKTPLHYAETEKQTRALLDAGADPNIKSEYGATPLHSVAALQQKRRFGDFEDEKRAFKEREKIPDGQEQIKTLIRAGAKISDDLKIKFTPPYSFIKQAAREVMEEKISNLKEQTIRRQRRDALRAAGLDFDAAELVNEYVGKQ